MATDNLYQSVFRARVISAITYAKAAAAYKHQGVKGEILEILIAQLFVPLLPADVGVGTGQILCSYSGRQSKQIDIILYNKAILPPLLVDGNLGVFPIESVLYAIEVKTTLTTKDLRTAHASAEYLETKFGYRPGKKGDDGEFKDHQVEKVRSVVFALSSKLKGGNRNEAERYKDIYGKSSPHVRAICVAGEEYWYDDGNNWIGLKDSSGQQYDGVLAFIGGVCNTYRQVAESRGNPLLGSYLIPDTPAVPGIVSVDREDGVGVACQDCGTTGKLTPNVGQMSITVNGPIVASEPCPRCGGKMASISGTYVFKGGKLQTP